MREMHGIQLVTAALVIILSAILVGGGCAAPKGEEFAIYLTRDGVPVTSMPVLSHVDIADQPVISINDIIAYHEITHELTLTAEAYERIRKLDVPVHGRSFVVCVNRGPVYWGAFWTPISSVPFNGITIVKPLRADHEGNTIKLDLGYPSPKFFEGEDLRSSSIVMQSLKQAGKLK